VIPEQAKLACGSGTLCLSAMLRNMAAANILMSFCDSSSKPRAEQSLVKFVTPQLHDINALEALADPALRGLYPPKALSRFADVLARCVQVN
jgi:hypothetical protein